MKRLFLISLVSLLGFAFVIPISPSWSAGTLQVTSPNGGEKWETGKKYAIKWVKGNAGATVKIQLLESGNYYKWVAKETKNDGKYVWKIPTTIATGSAYKIKIVSTKNKRVFDKSNENFTITEIVGDGGSISVKKPNGGEKWIATRKYAIKWDKVSAGTHVKIQLLKSGKHSLWVSEKTKNDGKYTWSVPTSVATGSAYKIRVISTSNATVKDLSNSSFTVTNGYCDETLRITKPRGGEIWRVGKQYEIMWCSNSGKSVRIQLITSTSSNPYYFNLVRTINEFTDNDGSYTWKVPNSTPKGSRYVIRIKFWGVTGTDDSERFTIYP